MPQIPGLPIDEPVTKPQASPAQFGSAGASIAGLGEQTEQMAAASSQVEGHLIRAQRQLKAKEAQIAFDRMKNQVYQDLSKETTPEGAQAVYDHSKGELDSVLAPFETDRVLSRELGLYRQQEDVEIQGTVNARKATIITKADEAANVLIGEKSLQEAINTKVGGGDPGIARTQFGRTLEKSVDHGTLLPEQAAVHMEKWDKEFEAGYIEAQLSSTNLQTVQDTVNEIQKHPENYPHLDKAQLGAFVEKGESAIVSRMSRQKEIDANAEEAKYWNNSPTGIVRMFTDVNGNFDQGKAESYVAGLGLSPEGEKQLLGNVKTHGSAANYQLKQSSVKQENDIVQALSGKHPDYKKADEMLNQYKSFTEAHPEFGDAFKSLKTYEYAQQEHARSEAIYERGVHNEDVRMKREQEQYDSFDLLGQMGPAIQRGEYSDAQLRSMAGKGKGKLLPQQVNEAIQLSHSMETDPENKPYINSIWNDTAIPTAVQGEVISEFHSWLRQNPKASGQEKAAEVKRLTDPDKIDQINTSLDQLNDRLNGVPPATQGGIWNRLTSNPEGGSIFQPTGRPPQPPGAVGTFSVGGREYYYDKDHKNLGLVPSQ